MRRLYIRTMAKSELILLHDGYGMAIRNKWLHGNRDRKLINFFHEKGIEDPDDASMVIIDALWGDLNRNLSPSQRDDIDRKRQLIARKRLVYEKLESECELQLKNSQTEFERCYELYGLPSENPFLKKPLKESLSPIEEFDELFSENTLPIGELVVEKTGHIKNIVFCESASNEVKQCLQKTIEQFKFSPFTDDEIVTIQFIPHCRVSERDLLHQ